MIPGDPGSGLRIPPHSEEAERGVLGSILLDPVGSIDKCLAKRLGGDAFYDRRHQALFEQMVDMSQANKAMDAITIAAKVGENGKMFGSVGLPQIIEKLQEQGIEIDRSKIVLTTPLHELGVFDVAIKLHPEVTGTLKVWIVEDK